MSDSWWSSLCSCRHSRDKGSTKRSVHPTARIVKREYIAMNLGLAFGLLVAILIGIGFLGLSRMDQINADLEGVLGRRWGRLQLAREALVYSGRNSRLTMEVFLLNDKKLIDPVLSQRAENTQKISELVAKLEEQCDSSEEKQTLAAVLARRSTP